MQKKVIACILLLVCILNVGCSKAEEKCSIEGCENKAYTSGLCPDHLAAAKGDTAGTKKDEVNSGEPNKVEEIVEEKDILDATEEEILNYATSTCLNDTDVGLKNIKYDTAKGEMTDIERMVAEYFNTDYLFVNSIEALQRYNKIFDNAMIQSYVCVEKILSYDGDDFTILAKMLESTEEFSLTDTLPEERRMIVHGTSGDSRVIVNDIIQINGRYNGIITEVVDGVSITVPDIKSYRTYVSDPNDEDRWYYAETPSRFSKLDVKNIAKCIFGDDITVRKDKFEDYDDPDEAYLQPPCYVCELDNQSNAKFSKYFFYERYGTIYDAVHPNYEISFSGDFKHFYLFMYDYEMESLTLEYYDNSFNKIWKREFENTIRAKYDVTKNNLYIIANNELYIINTETGEDTFKSVFVGPKVDIRKFSNGLLLISNEKADAFMYVDLDGNIAWRANVSKTFSYGNCQTQYVDGKIIVSTKGWSNDKLINYYYVIDSNDGTVLYEGEVEAPAFQQYG